MEQVESKSEAEERRLHAEIAKHLASCSKKIREKAVEILKVLLQSTPRISDEALRRLWKALFFCVWRADKQPVQAHLVRNLASLISSLEPSLSRRYFQVFLQTIRREGAGIDHLRLDKFHLMITRFLSAVFIFLRDHNWESELVRNYMTDLVEWSLLSKDTYLAESVDLHLVDVFLKELIGFLPVEYETIDPLFEPFCKILATCSQKALVNRVKTGVFDEILRAGMQYLNLIEVKFSMDNETTHTFCESSMDDAKNRTEQLGFIALRCGMYKRLFEIAESEETSQANREVIYAVAAEFEKLEKQMPVLLTAHGNMLQVPRVRTVCSSHELINGQLENSARHGLGNERGNADKKGKKRKRSRNKFQETNGQEGDQRRRKLMKKTQNLEEPAATVPKVLVSNDVTSEVNENSKHDVLPLKDADKGRNNRKRKRKKSQETNREEGDQRKTQNLEEPISALHEVHFSNDVTSEVNENSKHDGFPLENADTGRKKRKWERKRMRKESQKTNGENEKLEYSTSQGLEKERNVKSHKGRKKIRRGKRTRKKSQETNGENGKLEDSTSQGLEKERKDEPHKGRKKTRRGKRKRKKSQETNGENGKLKDSTSEGLEKETKDESHKGRKKTRRGKRKRKKSQETNGENGTLEDSTSQGLEKERMDKSQETNGRKIKKTNRKKIKKQKKKTKKSHEYYGKSRNGHIPFTLFL